MKKMIFAIAMALTSMTGMAMNHEQENESEMVQGQNSNYVNYDPVKPYLKEVRDAKSREELLKLMCSLDVQGFGTAPFSLALTKNPIDSSELVMGVEANAATLPRVFYACPDEEQQAVVEAARKQNKDLFRSVGYNDEEAERKMQAAWIIEHQIGVMKHERGTHRKAHMMSWAQLLDNFQGIDWEGYRQANHYPKDIRVVNVAEPEPLHMVDYILSNTNIELLRAYMELQVIKTCSEGQAKG